MERFWLGVVGDEVVLPLGSVWSGETAFGLGVGEGLWAPTLMVLGTMVRGVEGEMVSLLVAFCCRAITSGSGIGEGMLPPALMASGSWATPVPPREFSREDSMMV